MSRAVLPLFPKLPTAVQDVLLYDYGASVTPGAKWSDELLPHLSELVDRRLAGLTIRVVREKGLILPIAARSLLHDSEFSGVIASERAVMSNRDALRLLGERSIPYLVIKGPAIASQYGRPVERPFSDLDIVVQPQSFSATVALLGRTLGYREAARNHMPWRTFNTTCREAINLVGDAGGRLDVHHRVPPWVWARGLTFRTMFARRGTVLWHDMELPAASLEDNLLIAALHIFSDRNQPGTNLVAWRDVLTLSRVADPNVLVEYAMAANLTGWLQWIVGSLPEKVRPVLLTEALRDTPARVPRAVRLRMSQPPHFGSRHLVGHALRLPVPNGLLYLAGMTLPSPAFLREKYPDARAGRYRRWWTEALPRLLAARRSIADL